MVTTPKGRFAADYLICGTGGDMDVALRPELAAFSEHIATWADRYTPPQDEEERLCRYPSLGSDYAFLEKTPGAERFFKKDIPFITRSHPQPIFIFSWVINESKLRE